MQSVLNNNHHKMISEIPSWHKALFGCFWRKMNYKFLVQSDLSKIYWGLQRISVYVLERVYPISFIYYKYAIYIYIYKIYIYIYIKHLRTIYLFALHLYLYHIHNIYILYITYKYYTHDIYIIYLYSI